MENFALIALFVVSLALPVTLFLFLRLRLRLNALVAVPIAVATGWAVNVAFSFVTQGITPENPSVNGDSPSVVATFGWVSPAVLVLLTWLVWRLRTCRAHVRCRHCEQSFDLPLWKMTGFPAWKLEITFCPHCSGRNVASILAGTLSQFIGSIAAVVVMVLITSNFDVMLFPKSFAVPLLLVLLLTMFGSMYAILYAYYRICDQPFI